MSFFGWFPDTKHGAPYVSHKSHTHTTQALSEDTTPVEHTDKYKIVVVLDESGSMDCIRDSMRTALNGLISEQRTVKERPCNFTLVKFSDNVHRVIKNKPLDQVKSLEQSDYSPNGNTALYDAVGDTINWYRHERDVLMVIITDGQENSSKKYRKDQVLRMIKEKEQYAGWSYVYLSCDLNTAAQGDGIGLSTSKACSNCIVAQSRYGDFIGNVSEAIKNNRQYNTSVQSQLNH